MATPNRRVKAWLKEQAYVPQAPPSLPPSSRSDDADSSSSRSSSSDLTLPESRPYFNESRNGLLYHDPLGHRYNAHYQNASSHRHHSHSDLRRPSRPPTLRRLKSRSASDLQYSISNSPPSSYPTSTYAYVSPTTTGATYPYTINTSNLAQYTNLSPVTTSPVYIAGPQVLQPNQLYYPQPLYTNLPSFPTSTRQDYRSPTRSHSAPKKRLQSGPERARTVHITNDHRNHHSNASYDQEHKPPLYKRLLGISSSSSHHDKHPRERSQSIGRERSNQKVYYYKY